MGDLFEKAPNDLYGTTGGAHDWRKGADEFIRSAEEHGKNYLAQREIYANKFKVNLTDGQLSYMNQSIEDGTLDEDEIYRQAASMYIGKRTSLPHEYVRANLENFAAMMNIDYQRVSPAGFWRHIESRYKMSDANTTANELKGELMMTDDPKWRAMLLKEIKRLERVSEQFYTGEPDTKTLKGKAMWALGTIADSLPYMRNMAWRQAAGTAVGSVAGVPELGAFIGWQYGAQVEGGALYYELLEKGVDHDIARGAGMIGGALSSAVEQLMWGAIAKMGSAIKGAATGKPAVGKLANYIVSHVFKDLEPGGAGYRTMTLLTDYLLTIPQEGGEEGMQSIITGFAELIAINIHNARMEGDIAGLSEDEKAAIRALREVQKKPVKEIMKEAGMEAFAGMVAAVGTGIPGVAFNSVASVREAKRLKRESRESASFAEFDEYARKSPNFEGLPEKTVTDSINRLWEDGEKHRNVGDREKAQSAGKNRYASMPTLEAPGEMRKKADGRYDVKITGDENEDGSGTGSLILYDPPTRQRMGSLEYSWDAETNAVKVEGLSLSQAITNREEVIGGMLKELAWDNTEMNIDFNPDAKMGEAAGVDLKALKGSLIEANPRGAEHGLNYFRSGDRFTQTREMNADIEHISKARNMSLEEARNSYETMDAAFRNFNLDTHEMIGRMGIISEKDLRAIASEKPGGIEAQVLQRLEQGQLAAQKEGKTITGGTVVLKVDENGSRILTGKEALDEAFDSLRAVTVLTENSNPSTLHHEWLHFMARVVIPNSPRYRALLEEAVGKKLEDFTEKDHEWLSENYERYLRTGEAPTPGLKALFRRIAEALKQFVMEGNVSPQLRKFFDELLAGPDAALLDGSRQEESGGERGMARVQTDNEQQKAFAEMTQAERVLQSDLYTQDEKAEMLYAMKRDPLDRLGQEDKKHGPTAALIARAMNILDEAERENVIKNIRELRDAYEGKAAEFKAPNGKESLLLDALGQERGKEAWYAVRTDNFKEWFGDWERASRIEEFEKSDNLILEGNEYKGKYELNKESILNYLNNILKKETMHNPFIKGDIKIAGKGIKKLTSWGMSNDVYKKLFAHIPEMTEKAILLETENKREAESPYYKYSHLVTGVQIDGKPYTVHLILGENQGQWYYSHILLDMEKGSLLAGIQQTKPGHPIQTSLPHIKDSTLLRLLQVNSSKITDENGEPQAVFRGDKAGKDRFANRQGVFHASDKAVAEGYSSGGLYDLFLDIKNPLIMDEQSFTEARERINNMLEGIYEQDDSELAHNAQFQELRENYLAFRNEEGSAVRDFYNDFLPEVSEETDTEEFKEILIKSMHDANTFEWRQIDYRDIDILNPFIQALGYDGIARPYDPAGQARGKEYITFEPEQIKSATGNAGTFSNNNDSMLFQTAYQGSPYMFDKHDNSHVGSVWGNLHHGWGHYLYGQKKAAEWFGKSVSKYMNENVIGQLYEVDIPGDDKLLQWEKPISEQADVVRQAADRLITWDKNGNSNFNKAFNLRKFKDGNYGFLRSIDGKAKWATMEEAKAAAKEDIKKTLTGKEFYTTLSKSVGAREASLLLDHLGVKGTKYFDKSTEKIGVPRAYNYVIYGDGDINITNASDMLFQTAYHGSPNQFDSFDNSYIDTTDGGRMFGYGHNFASRKELAEFYRRNSVGLKNNGKVTQQKGQLYEVEIPGDEVLLDWDNVGQPEQVKEGLKKLFAELNLAAVSDDTGGQIYQKIAFEGNKKGVTDPEQWASYKLNTYGIVGIQHMDDGFGRVGEGSKNYVIFDDNEITIKQTFYDILFQMTRDEIQAEALRYSSWQKWMEADVFGEAVTEEKVAAYRRDAADEEPRTKTEKEAWYEKQWNEARVLAREAALGDDGERAPANAESVNPELLDAESFMDEDENLDWNPDKYEGEAGLAETDEEEGSFDREPDLYDREADAETGRTDPDNGLESAVEDDASRDNEKKPITTSEANRRFISKLPKIIDDFLLLMGRTMRENLEHFGAITEEDVAEREHIERDKERIYNEVHQYVRALALRATTGKKLNDRQRRTAMSHMRRSLESGATVYRELYTSVSRDKEFTAYAENEIPDAGTKGEAQRAANEAGGLTAFQRTRLAEQIIDKDIARKIRKGTATQAELEDYLKRGDEELRKMDKEIKTLEEELAKSKGETKEERAEAESWYRSYLKTRADLKAAVKEAEGLQKKLDKSYKAKSNMAERMKEGRLKAEAKLKEKLAGKRDEIKALRQRLKEDTAHAEKQGRLTKAWQWAEWRAKLDKKDAEREQRAADRKAAKKALEANKKLSSWIMSADRVGMNIWVRQRELILGIQNALFATSKTAVEARQLDAEIKNITKKIEKETNRISKAKNEDEMEAVLSRLSKYEEYLENLKSQRANIEIMVPELSGMKTDQAGTGEDTYDTGTIVYNGKTISVEEFRQQFYEGQIRYGFMDSKLRKALRKSAPSAKTLGEKRKLSASALARNLSQEDLLAIKTVMQQLNKEGRANWERRQFAVHLNQRELIKAFLFGQDELEEEGETSQAKRYIKAMQSRDIEERKKLLAKGANFERKLFMTFDDKRLVQWMDGNKKRALYRFVIRERLRYANRRDKAIDARTGRIMDIIGRGSAEEIEAEKGLNERARNRKNNERAEARIKELGEKNITIEGVGPSNASRKWEFGADFNLDEAETAFEEPTKITVSLADLMFMSVALDNKFARSHILYGNLWSKDEQAFFEKFITKEKKMPAEVLKKIEAIGADKEKILRKAIDQYLFEDDGKGGRKAKTELMQITDAIRNDFEAHYPEMKAVYEDMFNEVIEGQDNYLPIMITEGKHEQAEKQNAIEALTQGSHQVRINPNKGMAHSRVDIGSTHQTKIETDIFKVFFNGVEREEHFAKFAPYVRDLNNILRGWSNNSRQLVSKLTDMYGKWAVDRLYQHINMVGLPPSANINNAWENAAGVGKALSGNMGVAYIAYNIPAWLAQYPQSIAGFFGKADARFILSSCLEIMKPGNDLVERVYEKSPKVKQRIINVAEEYKQYLSKQEGKLKEAQAKFIEVGMLGQKHADRTMVAAGWWALYQTALKKGMSEEDAVVFADEITAETQPDMHAIETSPQYKDEGLGKLFLRFSQPLNVIWMNLTYDSFISREKSFGSVVARVTAYGTAALIVAAMRGGLAKKDGEDRDPEELMKKIFYYMLVSPVAESTPLIGNLVSGSMERLITGDGKIYQSRYFDLAERLFNIPVELKEEHFEGAIRDAINALGLIAGLPTSEINRIIKAVKKENPWIIFGYDP